MGKDCQGRLDAAKAKAPKHKASKIWTAKSNQIHDSEEMNDYWTLIHPLR